MICTHIRHLLPNCLLYAKFQIILLNSKEHDGNNMAGELISSLFNKFSTMLALLVHPCGTEFSVEHTSWLRRLSLSKRTNGADSLSLARYSSLKILSTSVSRSIGSSFWSSNLNPISRLNWSYLVNTTITGTRKAFHVGPQLTQLRLDIPFLSGHISPTYFRSSDGRALSIGTQYLKEKRCGFAITNTEKEQTILRAVYSPMYSPATYDEQTLEQSSARFHLLLQILGSRGKRNHDGFWRLIRS